MLLIVLTFACKGRDASVGDTDTDLPLDCADLSAHDDPDTGPGYGWTLGERGETTGWVIIDVSNYGDIACVANETEVRCWGEVEHQESISVLDLAVSENDACYVLADGTLSCFALRGSASKPLHSVPEGTFLEVDLMDEDACGVRTDRSVACWGLRDTEERSGNYEQITMGSYRTNHHAWCAFDGEGEVLCKLHEDYLPSGLEQGFLSVGITDLSVCGLYTTGVVVCREYNEEAWETVLEGDFRHIVASGAVCALDQNGWTSCENRHTYRQWACPPEGGPFSVVGMGRGVACGLEMDGSVLCWGHLSQDAVLDPI